MRNEPHSVSSALVVARFPAIVAAAAFLLSSCSMHSLRTARPALQLELSQVVGAIQYAVDQAAADESLWEASRAELEHWGQECELRSEAAEVACAPMTLRVGTACRALCNGNVCTPAETAECNRLLEGNMLGAACLLDNPEDRPSHCAALGQLDLTSCAAPQLDNATRNLCLATNKCNIARAEAAAPCKAAEQARLPRLVSAKVALEIAQTQKAGGELSVIIFSAGVSREVSRSQTIELTLVPRPKGKPGNYLRGFADATSSVSDAEKTLGRELLLSLKKALSSVAPESVQPGNSQIRKRAPLLLGGADVTLVLSANDNGTLGIALDHAPSIKFGGGLEASTRRANTLVISYVQPE